MNNANLIKLGAFAQKRFGMKDDFTVIEVPENHSRVVEVLVPREMNYRGIEGIVEIDEVNLVLVEAQVANDQVHVFMGYSEKANTLVVAIGAINKPLTS